MAGLLLVPLVPSAAPQAATIQVDSAADVVATDGACTLREAIANANADADTTGGDCAAGSGADTIDFAADATITLAGSQLPVIASEVTIVGNGPGLTIIEAASTFLTAVHRVFEVGATGSLGLEQLTVRHGSASLPGGGGAYSQGELSVTGCDFSGNYGFDGGGLYNDGGTLSVTDSTVSGNALSDQGGGIYNLGGTLTLTDSTIAGNFVIPAGGVPQGGGIYNDGGDVTVLRSTLSGNAGAIHGGGIYNTPAGMLTVTNSTLSGNGANTGGGIFNVGTATVIHSTLSGNSSGTDGGGIYAIAGSLTLSRSLVAGNEASLLGAEIYVDVSALTLGGYNVLGHDLLTDEEAFIEVTPGPTDLTATSDGSAPTTLAAILGPLADNGGPTLTHPLAAGSPAIDFAASTGCVAPSPIEGVDQRGELRGVDIPGTGNEGGSDLCDAGAYEAQPPVVPVAPWSFWLLAPALLLAARGTSTSRSPALRQAPETTSA